MALSRTRRWLYITVLIIAALAGVQWTRAQFVHEWYRWIVPDPRTPGPDQGEGYARVFELNGSGVAWIYFECNTEKPDDLGFARLAAAPAEVRWMERKPTWRRVWFDWKFNGDGPNGVTVPYWFFVALGFAAMGMRAWLLRRRRRRINKQFCPDCGYDLRATPDRCPECGLAVESVNSMGMRA